jgi:hypothetical protein
MLLAVKADICTLGAGLSTAQDVTPPPPAILLPPPRLAVPGQELDEPVTPQQLQGLNENLQKLREARDAQTVFLATKRSSLAHINSINRCCLTGGRFLRDIAPT